MCKSLVKACLWDLFAIIVVWYARFVQKSFLGLVEAVLQKQFLSIPPPFPTFPAVVWSMITIFFFFLVCPEQLMKPVSFQRVPWENAIGFIGLQINSAQDKINLQAEIKCQVSLIVLCKSLTH